MAVLLHLAVMQHGLQQSSKGYTFVFYRVITSMPYPGICCTYISAHGHGPNTDPLYILTFFMPLKFCFFQKFYLNFGIWGFPQILSLSIRVNFHLTRGNSTCVPNIGCNGNHVDNCKMSSLQWPRNFNMQSGSAVAQW